ncbi:Putative B3 domain-containing protein At2g27410 [Linum perenne]
MVHGRRSPRASAGGPLSDLYLLAEAATAVGECGCGQSDPFPCFLASKQRKSAFLGIHHSLFWNPPKKTVVKLRLPSPPAVVAEAASAFPPPIVPEAGPFLFSQQASSFLAPPSSFAAATFAEDFTLPPPPSSLAAAVSAPTFPAVAAPPKQSSGRISPPSVAASPTLPVDSADLSEDDLIKMLKSRVSEIVEDFLENTFTLVIRKELTETDLRYQQLRLAIPGKQVVSDFLTDEENALFQNKNEKIPLGAFLDPHLELISGFQLTRWVMTSTPVYSLIKAWRSILDKRRDNKLKLEPGDEIELWSFRVASGKLCFVMVSEETRRMAAAAAAANESGSGTSGLTQEGSPDHGSSDAIDLDLKL